MGANMWWAKAEPELRSLYEWIDLQQQNSGNNRAGIAGGIVGGLGGVMGGSIGLLVGGMGLSPSIGVTVPLVSWAILSLGVVAWYLRSRTETEKTLARTVAEMRSFYWRLMSARWQGNVAAMIGQDSAAVLNKGAFEFLRCRNALRSPGWKAVQADSAYARARTATATAMEVGMARLVTMIGQGASPTDEEIVALIAEMKGTADEASQTANRLAEHRGLPIDATNELRKAIGDMRALNEADDEYSKITQDF
jgi:hypothetical protein